MTQLTDLKTTQISFIVVPKARINFDDVSSSDLEEKIKIIYGDDVKPVSSRFPDTFVLFDPNTQVGVTVLSEANIIIVGDKRVSSYTDRELTKLSQFVSRTCEIILKGEEINGFGINIRITGDLEEETDTAKFLYNHFIKPDISGKVEGIVGSSVRIFSQKEKYMNDLRIEPRFSKERKPTKTVTINQNSHFQTDKFPDFEELNKIVNSIYEELPQVLTKIIN